MADDDQQGYWVPYWTSPPAVPAPRPAIRPLLHPQPPLVTSSLSRRQPQAAATVATRGAGGATARSSPQVQPQATRLSSRPSPSRAHSLASPVGSDVPQEKIIREPPSSDTNKADDVGKKESGKDKKDKDHHQEKEDKDHHHGKKKEKHKDGHHGGYKTVITLAGENKGASMQISHHHAGGHGQEEAKERRARSSNKIEDGRREAEKKGVTAFVNSNVQVVNNSLVLQSSCSSSDPGVHLKVSAKSRTKGGDGEEGGGGAAQPAAPARKK